ncbi:MAG: HGGxSTG domain-containing protein [Sphingorhabdus sp.]
MSRARRHNFGPMMQSPRCGAKTRAGTPCLAPATRGRARCRMHGGAAGSGAPDGNRNALKHGVYTSEAIEWRKQINQLMRSSRALNAEI